MTKRILLTGASGFIGRHLKEHLSDQGVKIRAVVRNKSNPISSEINIGNIDGNTNWNNIINGCDTVIHLAACAHLLCKDTFANSFVYKTNVEGTEKLARDAAKVGVKHFIYLSTIGAVTFSNKEILREKYRHQQESFYGFCKKISEEKVKQIGKQFKMNITVIRPPLVYGPENPGNMARLFKIADLSIPLPYSALNSNRRSFVSISNLVDLISHCLKHPAAINKTLSVSDDEDISTAVLLQRIKNALGKPILNVRIPQKTLKFGLRLLGKKEWVDKLFGDLRVDISETKRLLGWKPKVTMEEELERTAKWWKTRKE